ncbi:MAG: Asp-tRNA(Asn)/Glu-tRNA(Gln) amidotransferase subunit GatA [Oscillospiraceae bacterium]|nr:Asp-tRNA(Asn)/Glu-tRNA(Gln) amidotransferase subunit GatA [Oscillospiraceae bacterium]
MKLYNLSVGTLSKMLENKEITSVELTENLLERIEETDKDIEGYITVASESAVSEAKKADERIAKGDISPLNGICASVKDNICTDKILTTCASKMLYNFVPPYDATVVKKLKEQGSVIVGKTNMDEFAMGSSTETSYFKKTKNPHDLTKVPGGSSGGSAAAVAADEAIFALGSDTGGSIRQPSAFCGVVGLKPTYGLVSRYGLVAFASSLDQIGPITKNVTDSAIVLNAIAGYDKMDSTSADEKADDYTKSLGESVKGLKIGIPKEYIGEGIQKEVKDAILNAAKKYEEMGAEVFEFSLPMTKYALPAYYIMSSAEASSNLARFDGVKYGYRSENYTDLTDMYLKTRSEGFGSEVKRRIMLGTYALSAGYYDAYYKKAQQARTLIRNSFAEAFEKFDVILTPTTPTTAFEIGKNITDPITMYLNDICTVSVNIAGLPAISIPCGYDDKNMPIGLQLIAKPFGENTLFKTAYAFEQNTDFAHKSIEREGK